MNKFIPKKTISSFNKYDIIGKTFNELTVLEYSHYDISRGYGRHFYKCKCSCGKICYILRNQLTGGKTKSCGHLNHINKDNEVIGKRFGRLVVIKASDRSTPGVKRFDCICDCGNKVTVLRKSLISGATTSCGCYSKEVHSKLLTSHGMSNTRFYRIYKHIIDRCYNKSNDSYQLYGGRGIDVSDEWREDFINFYDDMYSDYISMSEIYGENNISIDRKDNNKGYSKENCRWVTQRIQTNNLRRNVKYSVNDQIYTLMQLVEMYALPGIYYGLVRDRVFRLGWNIKDALTIPIDSSYSRNLEANTNYKQATRNNKGKRMIYFDIPDKIDKL